MGKEGKLKAPQIKKRMLQFRLALARAGAPRLLAAALCAGGAAAWLWAIPQQKLGAAAQQAQLEQRKLALTQAPAAPAAAPLSPAQANLAAFYAALGKRQGATEQLAKLFLLARESGLVLEKGEYKGAYSALGRSYSYQALLPVKGSYAAIQRFCQKLLLAIPFASLDEISFRRDAVAAGALQAKLRITLHLADAAPESPAPPAAQLMSMQAAQAMQITPEEPR